MLRSEKFYSTKFRWIFNLMGDACGKLRQVSEVFSVDEFDLGGP